MLHPNHGHKPSAIARGSGPCQGGLGAENWRLSPASCLQGGRPVEDYMLRCHVLAEIRGVRPGSAQELIPGLNELADAIPRELFALMHINIPCIRSSRIVLARKGILTSVLDRRWRCHHSTKLRLGCQPSRNTRADVRPLGRPDRPQPRLDQTDHCAHRPLPQSQLTTQITDLCYGLRNVALLTQDAPVDTNASTHPRGLWCWARSCCGIQPKGRASQRT